MISPSSRSPFRVGRSARSARSGRSRTFQNHTLELRVAVSNGPNGDAAHYRLELLGADAVLYLSLDDRRGDDTVSHMVTTSKRTRPEAVVVYVRCSTEEQAASGLGIDAQLTACRQYAQQRGARIVEEVREVESGGNDDRPELARAMALAARCNGTLVVAKLDRLGRSVAKVATALKSGLKVVVAESPDASTLELHLRAVVAEEERRAISARTTVALAEARKRGVLLGSRRPGHWEGREEARLRGSLAGSIKAKEARLARAAGLLEQAKPILARTAGSSLRDQAEALQAAGVLTATGCSTWTPTGVKRLRAQLAST